MKKRRPIRNFFKRAFNIKRWMATEQIKDSGKELVQEGKGLFKIKKAKHSETFEEAVTRLNLTGEDIDKRTKQFLYTAYAYYLLVLLLLVYALYLMFFGHILALISSIALILLILSYALREHFWYMQMKKKKLGCSLFDLLKFVCKSYKIKIAESSSNLELKK